MRRYERRINAWLRLGSSTPPDKFNQQYSADMKELEEIIMNEARLANTAGELGCEKRAARRQRVLKDGKVVLPNQASVVDCTIRDMSPTGARLVCLDQQAVPDSFALVTVSSRLMCEVTVRWRRGDAIGVEFVGEPQFAPAYMLRRLRS